MKLFILLSIASAVVFVQCAPAVMNNEETKVLAARADGYATAKAPAKHDGSYGNAGLPSIPGLPSVPGLPSIPGFSELPKVPDVAGEVGNFFKNPIETGEGYLKKGAGLFGSFFGKNYS